MPNAACVANTIATHVAAASTRKYAPRYASPDSNAQHTRLLPRNRRVSPVFEAFEQNESVWTDESDAGAFER